MKNIKVSRFGDMTGTTLGRSLRLGGGTLETLEGSPKILRGDFEVSGNLLKSLQYGPEQILDDSDYNCSDNQLTSLEFGPKLVEGTFNCKGNNIKDPYLDIVKYQIKAEKYITDIGFFTFEDLEEDFKKGTLDKRVTRPSMRKLLGLK